MGGEMAVQCLLLCNAKLYLAGREGGVLPPAMRHSEFSPKFIATAATHVAAAAAAATAPPPQPWCESNRIDPRPSPPQPCATDGGALCSRMLPYHREERQNESYLMVFHLVILYY